MATILWKDGESQQFDTKKVQSALASGWCVTDEKVVDDPVDISDKTSQDFSIRVAEPIIEGFETIDEVEKFCIGDERNGIQKAALKRITDLCE
jgi:hypothetical protein